MTITRIRSVTIMVAAGLITAATFAGVAAASAATTQPPAPGVPATTVTATPGTAEPDATTVHDDAPDTTVRLPWATRTPAATATEIPTLPPATGWATLTPATTATAAATGAPTQEPRSPWNPAGVSATTGPDTGQGDRPQLASTGANPAAPVAVAAGLGAAAAAVFLLRRKTA